MTDGERSAVRHITVAGDEAETRLDRWFRRRFPELSHGRLEKLLRTGQVRLDGRRTKAGERLVAGQTVRVPPLSPEDPAAQAAAGQGNRARPAIDPALGDTLRDRVLVQDDHLLVLDKPAGLAVQGGAGTARHLDGHLDALRFGAADRPRLVHRLDRDTSGVLVLARTAAAATALTRCFRGKAVRKLYWAAVAGAPKPASGRVDAPLAKAGGSGAEKMAIDADAGRRAVTHYRTVDRIKRQAAWLALAPVTGRTHQLRAHCTALGTPIIGDGKYGGRDAFPTGLELPRQLHLHARRIMVPHPMPDRPPVDVTAPLPPHMVATWDLLGFTDGDGDADALF